MKKTLALVFFLFWSVSWAQAETIVLFLKNPTSKKLVLSSIDKS